MTKPTSITPAHQVVYPSPETKNDRRINWKPITDALTAGKTLFMADTELNRSGVKYLQLFFDRLGDESKSFHSAKIVREDVPGRYIWVGSPTGLTDVQYVEIGKPVRHDTVESRSGYVDAPLEVWDETAPPPTNEELKAAVNELRDMGPPEQPYLITSPDVTDEDVAEAFAYKRGGIEDEGRADPEKLRAAGIPHATVVHDEPVKHATADVTVHLNEIEASAPGRVVRPQFHDRKPEPKPEPRRATISPR